MVLNISFSFKVLLNCAILTTQCTGVYVCEHIIFYYNWLNVKVIVLSEIKDNNNIDLDMRFWYLLHC